MKNLKKAICTHIISLLEEKIHAAEQAVMSSKESRNNETKSTAGDKHETSRAMMQIELDNCERQLGKLIDLKRQMLQMDVEKERKMVEPGCLVDTENERYFVSIGLGKIEVNQEVFYALSIQSPIGQLLLGKKEGEKFSFRGKDNLITGVW